MKKILLVILVMMTFMLFVKAEEVIDATLYTVDEEVTTVSADLVDKFDYNLNDQIKVSKEVNGSGIYLGQDINVNTDINGIGLFLSSIVNVNGKLEYGIIFGKEVTINNFVSRDLFVASTNFKLNKGTVINRDLFVVSNNAVIEGDIVRDAYIGASRVVIKKGTTISGDVRIGANSITIEDDVNIIGVLKYNESAIINIKENNQFNILTYKGEFLGNDNEKTHDIVLYFYKTIGFILFFLLLNWLFPKLFIKFKKLYDKPINYLKNIGIGLGVLIVIPLLSLFLLMLPYTMFIGLIILAFYFIFMYFSYVLAGYLLGELIYDKLLKNKKYKMLITILGISLINILCLIPFVSLFIILLGYGSIFILIGTKGK